MDRRSFLAASGAAAASFAATDTTNAQADGGRAVARPGEPFQLLYAPHFGMFKNHAASLEDQLQFAADQGFRAWEDNGMSGKDEATQRRLAAKMTKLGMTMGVFIAHGDFSQPTFASGRKDHQERVLKEIDNACVVAE